MAPIVLSPTELAVIDFDIRSSANVVQLGPSTEMGPIFDSYGAKLMLILESVDMNAANDVREEQNLTENEESIQTREKLGSTTLNTAHTDKRSNNDVLG
jgi:hypothetical protein